MPKSTEPSPLFLRRGGSTTLRDAFEWQGYHVIGIQEANANLSATWANGSMLRAAQGGRRGTSVVELWISKPPIGKVDGVNISLQKQNLTCLAEDDGIVLVRYSGEYLAARSYYGVY